MLEILLVEDEQATAEIVRRYLQDAESDVHDVPKLSEALRLCEIVVFDLIVLDLRLLDSTIEMTIDSIPLFKRRQPQTPVLVLSGYPDPEIRQKSLERGADLFVCKRDAYDRGAKALFAAFYTLISGRKDHRSTEEDFLASAKLLEKLATA